MSQDNELFLIGVGPLSWITELDQLLAKNGFFWYWWSIHIIEKQYQEVLDFININKGIYVYIYFSKNAGGDGSILCRIFTTDLMIDQNEKYFLGLKGESIEFLNNTDISLSNFKKFNSEEVITPPHLKAAIQIVQIIDEKEDEEIEDEKIKSYEGLLSTLNKEMEGKTLTRINQRISRIIRNDTRIVQLLKEKSNYKCQFPGCTSEIKTRSGINYIEVAHIIPVKKGGKSVIGNLLVLCPNHHKELDYGELYIIEQTDTLLRGNLNGRDFIIKF